MTCVGSLIPVLREGDARATEPSRTSDLETMAPIPLTTKDRTMDATESWNLRKENIEAEVESERRKGR